MSSFKELLGLEFIKFAEENNLKKVQACIDLEVDINAENSSGDTAAHVAAWKGNAEVINMGIYSAKKSKSFPNSNFKIKKFIH